MLLPGFASCLAVRPSQICVHQPYSASMVGIGAACLSTKIYDQVSHLWTEFIGIGRWEWAAAEGVPSSFMVARPHYSQAVAASTSGGGLLGVISPFCMTAMCILHVSEKPFHALQLLHSGDLPPSIEIVTELGM